VPEAHERAAPLVTALVVLGALAWIAACWLPLGWTEKELAAAASRVWDLRREVVEHGALAWWTPWFMGGSPYALQHAQGLPLLAWLGLALGGVDLAVAGKTVALLAIAASAVTMYACARALLGSSWAAAVAAVAYALHPQQAFRAGGDEHVGLSVAFALVPLVWLTWTRATASGSVRSAFLAALALTALLWTSSRHVLVIGLLLGIATLARAIAAGRTATRPALRGTALTFAFGAALGAFCIVPAVEESRHARFFAGEDVSEWQRQLAFRGLLGIVDRDGILTAPAMAAAEPVAVADPAERAARERLALLKFESGAKYAGIVLLALAAGALLLGRRRADPTLLGTLAVAFVLCVATAAGLDALATAHLTTVRALFEVAGVPAGTRLTAVALPLLAVAALAGAAVRGRREVAVLGLALALAVLAWVPLFRLLAALPFADGVRAPFVFYDIPATFVLCLLAGFFVTDVVEAGRWRARTPAIALALIALVLVDHAPAARAFAEKPGAARATSDVEAAYGALRDVEPAWGKTYYVSTRNQHLLGPLHGGKPQVFEAWTKWMSPIGTGLLNERSWTSPHANRAYLDLAGARWIVFDKGDATMMASRLAREMLDFYRGWFRVHVENESVVVLDNATAWPWLSMHRRAALFLGDVRRSPDVALALAARRVPMVHLDADATVPPIEVAGGVYVDRDAEPRLAELPALRAQAIPLAGERVRLPEPGAPIEPAAARDVRRGNGDIRLRVDMAEPGLLVVAESFHPHWRATLDGKPADLWRVSAGLMGVAVGAGTHDVHLHFRVPAAYWVAGLVSLVTLVGGLASTRRRT
jgi:hypothetical protein